MGLMERVGRTGVIESEVRAHLKDAAPDLQFTEVPQGRHNLLFLMNGNRGKCEMPPDVASEFRECCDLGALKHASRAALSGLEEKQSITADSRPRLALYRPDGTEEIRESSAASVRCARAATTPEFGHAPRPSGGDGSAGQRPLVKPQ